ncbi:MAG: MTH895/ArsE family thioredoxin-like protein [Acidobacteriia bacterium]|nr:MTH895/ArsE family thioredoxin-like protein [Terriglobia bacterium]
METTITKIEVLGPGCPRCQETYRVVRHVVETAGLACQLVKVESYQRMAQLGVMATPAIAIDGAVVMTGHIPKAEEVRELLGIG